MSAPLDAETRAVRLLTECGFKVQPSGPADLRVERDGIITNLEVKVRRSATYRWDAEQMLDRTESNVLLVVPKAPAALALFALEQPRLNIVALNARIVFWAGQAIAPDDDVDAQRIRTGGATASRRRPWAKWALLRVLAQSDRPQTQTELARKVGVSQPAISQSLAHLIGTAERSGPGWRATSRERAWTMFLADYPGAGGVTTYWFSLDPVARQSSIALEAAGASGTRALLSGDSAADELAPWRVPRMASVYASAALNLAAAGFAESRPDQATLEVTVPADRTLWVTALAWEGSRTVDPAMVAYDVLRSGGPDAPDAVKRLAGLALADGLADASS